MAAGGSAGGRSAKAKGGVSAVSKLKAERTRLSIQALQQPQNRDEIYGKLAKVTADLKVAERAERKAQKGKR